MNKLRDLIANNAGVLSTAKLTENTEFDFEKRKLEVKSRSINLITMLMNDIKSIKRMIDDTKNYPMYDGSKEEPLSEEQKRHLKRIAYKILRKHFEDIERIIESELGCSHQEIVNFKPPVIAPEVEVSFPDEGQGEY